MERIYIYILDLFFQTHYPLPRARQSLKAESPPLQRILCTVLLQSAASLESAAPFSSVTCAARSLSFRALH